MQDIIAALMVAFSGFFFAKSAGATLTPTFDTQINSDDLDTLARTLWGEARGDGYTGMQAVANVIMNRYAQGQASLAKQRQFGATVADVCRKPYQFSAWLANDPNFAKMMNVNESDAAFRMALDIARAALQGQLTDITGGADHYHTAAVNPAWSRGVQPVTTIKSHQFYDLA